MRVHPRLLALRLVDVDDLPGDLGRGQEAGRLPVHVAVDHDGVLGAALVRIDPVLAF